VKIERVSADYEYAKNVYVSRSQFPITLAWALTINKTQGLSLKAVMVYLGKDIFEAGMAYVALSRAVCLKNVFLIEFDPSILYCNIKVIEEYNRLYTNYKMMNRVFNKYNILPNEKDNSNINIKIKKIKADLITPLEMIENNKQIYNKRTKFDLTKKNNNKNQQFTPNHVKKNNNTNFNLNQIVHPSYHLIFNNHKNGCFANVAIQTLLCCSEIFYYVNINYYFNLIIYFKLFFDFN
jgi:hypothetical protein